MTYNLTSDSGTITIPELQIIDYKGLKLIGRNTPDWNEPIQQNFVTLADQISNISTETSYTNSLNNTPSFQLDVLTEDDQKLVNTEWYYKYGFQLQGTLNLDEVDIDQYGGNFFGIGTDGETLDTNILSLFIDEGKIKLFLETGSGDNHIYDTLVDIPVGDFDIFIDIYRTIINNKIISKSIIKLNNEIIFDDEVQFDSTCEYFMCGCTTDNESIIGLVASNIKLTPYINYKI